MKKRFLSVILLIMMASIACHENNQDAKTIEKKYPRPKIFSALTDSTRIGVPGRFKLKIHQTRYSPDSTTAFFEFYYLSNDGWKFTQSHEMPVLSIAPLHTFIQDYNGDGKGDLSFNCGVLGRSANELRTLFLFRDSSLVRLVNSDKFPNLQSNAKLNCMDSWILTKNGSRSTFLRTVNDSLLPFATVNVIDTVLTVVENDNVILQRRVRKNAFNRRYKNYKPLDLPKDQNR